MGKLPGMYVQVGGKDILRDDGIVYAKALGKDGVKVKLDVFDGRPHESFVSLRRWIRHQNNVIKLWKL